MKNRGDAASGGPLPPGQRERPDFPRFGLTKFARRFPQQTSHPEVRITGDVEQELLIPDALEGLARVEQVSDFHCVTTWTRRSLRWGGVRFADFYESVVAPRARPFAGATCCMLRGQDGARTSLLLEDLLAPDVLLADTLDAQPLTIGHGAPLRLVAPALYGYKSVKHLSRIEIRRDDATFRPSAFRFMDHPRARVALEERGRRVPGWFLRYLYRPLVAPTIARFERAMDEYARERKPAENPMEISLRDVLESDLPIFFEHQSDPVANDMAAFPPRNERAFMDHWRSKILGDPTVAKRTILADGRVAGHVVCFSRSGKREVGYWIGRDHWGKGIATRALSGFLGQVTERPLHAIVAIHNAGSIRVLEKCGFTIESRGHGSSDAGGPVVEELTFRLGASAGPG